MTKAEIIANYVKKLNISVQEAEEMWAEDHEIDKMSVKECQSDLTAEQVKNSKKVTNIGQKTVKNTKKTAKTRKIDTEKEQIITELAEFLQKFDKNVEIVNKNNEISFIFNENSYSLKLTKHRKTAK